MLISTFRHWLPIVTFCPVNSLPDLIYVSILVSVGKDEPFPDLYQVRKAVRKAVAWKKMYMEDVAAAVAKLYPQAEQVEVRLAFNRHVVTIIQ